ncbi:hypothetical protein Fmac_006550 [Flemingia macrophylla]|uniref:Uncharacterized protein n=1 Tax=Flemingia macrophylla TaxID=520843 RepID=A0ABD1NAY9_9FABA
MRHSTKHPASVGNLATFPIHVDQAGGHVDILVQAAPERGPMKRFTLAGPRHRGTGFDDKRVGVGIGKCPSGLHGGEGGEGVGKEGVLAVVFDEGVPKEGGGGEDAAEDGGGVGGGRVCVGDEERNEEVVLLESPVDDARVHLLEVFTALAALQEGGYGGSRTRRRRGLTD